MEKIKVVIVEDEPATARHLAHVLEETNRVLVVKTLYNIKEAILWFRHTEFNYDLVFMDIQLGDGISFAIFESTDIKKPVIFVTAYNDFAAQAFRNNGIDYILKPFDEEEITRSIEKFNKTGYKSEETQVHLPHVLFQKPYKQSFLIHYKDKLIPIDTLKIAWFYTSYDVVYLSTLESDRFTVDFTLEQLEQQLDPKMFFRANRQFIVNRQAVLEVGFHFNGRLNLKINPVTEVSVLISKARATLFKNWMQA